MYRFQRCAAAASVVIAAAFSPVEPVNAQVVRGFRGGGIAIRAPYAPPINIRVAPRVLPVRPMLLPRRPLVVVPPIAGPVVAGRRAVAAAVLPPVQVYSSADVITAPYLPRAISSAPGAGPPTATVAASGSYPTAAELQTMDDSTLLNTLLGLADSVQAEVGQFDTGATWQQYFRFPQDALPPPVNGRVTLGLRSLQTMLARFDKIEADGQYPMISGLPSFGATQAALAEVLQRFGPQSGAEATPAEEMPAPRPTAPPQTQRFVTPPQSERSVLAN